MDPFIELNINLRIAQEAVENKVPLTALWYLNACLRIIAGLIRDITLDLGFVAKKERDV